jgi:hypothetical protein
MNKQTQETIFVSTFAQLQGHLMPSKNTLSLCMPHKPHIFAQGTIEHKSEYH